MPEKSHAIKEKPYLVEQFICIHDKSLFIAQVVYLSVTYFSMAGSFNEPQYNVAFTVLTHNKKFVIFTS
jgi:hypothetical protein